MLHWVRELSEINSPVSSLILAKIWCWIGSEMSGQFITRYRVGSVKASGTSAQMKIGDSKGSTCPPETPLLR